MCDADVLDKQYRKSVEIEKRFNEYNVAESIFKLEKDSFGTVKAQMDRSTNTDVFKLVAKYLYNNGIKDIKELKELLRKYMAVIGYLKFNSSKKLDQEKLILVEEFDAFEGGLSINDLKEKEIISENPFAKIYNYNFEDRNYNKLVLETIDYIKKVGKLKNDDVEKYMSLMNLYYDFFSTTTKFSYFTKENVTRFDIIIAEILSEGTNFENFNFHIEQEQFGNFVKNINPKQQSNYFRYYVLIGYLIDLNIKYGNFNFDKKVPVNNSAAYYKLMSGYKEQSYETVLFFDKKVEGNKGDLVDFMKINPKMISEFDFIFNDKEYSFTKKGIIEK